MKKHTKTLAVLLATTCLNGLYAMDLVPSGKGDGRPAVGPTTTAVAVRRATTDGSLVPLFSDGPIVVAMAVITPQGQELLNTIRGSTFTVDFPPTGLWERIQRESATPFEKNVLSGYYNAKNGIVLKAHFAAKATRQGSELEQRETASTLEQAQQELARLDQEIDLLMRNSGTLGVAARGVVVTQGEKGEGWVATDVDSDGFNVVVAKRHNTFDSVAHKARENASMSNPLMEAAEADALKSITPFPLLRLGRDYGFLSFFTPAPHNPLTGYGGEPEKGMFAALNALRRFHDGDLYAELQTLSQRVHAKAKEIGVAATSHDFDMKTRTLFNSIHTMALAIDNILILLGEGSLLGETFKRDIGKVIPAFTELEGLCSAYVETLGIQEKVSPVSVNPNESMFAVEKVLVSDIHKVARHLEKIISILKSKRGDANPFQGNINTLSAFIEQDKEFLAFMEGCDVGDVIASIEAENARLASELPAAQAAFEEAQREVQERLAVLEAEKAEHPDRDETLSDLKYTMNRSETEVTKRQWLIKSNTERWIPMLREMTPESIRTLHGFHGAFKHQFHVLQTPRVWESARLSELETLRQSITDLNMLVESLKGFYNGVHDEVVAVAAETGKVFDTRRATCMLADASQGYQEVELPPAHLMLGDVSDTGASGALVPVNPGMLTSLGLASLKDGPRMRNPLRDFSDVEAMQSKFADDLTKPAFKGATETHADVIARIQKQADVLRTERIRMATAARFVEVRDPLMDFDLNMMSLVQIKNVLGVARALAPNHYNIYFAPDLVDTMIHIAKGTYGKPLPEGDKGTFIQNLAETYQFLATHVEGPENLKAILEAYEVENFEQMHLEYQSDDPNAVPLITAKNYKVAKELLGELIEYKSRLGSK